MFASLRTKSADVLSFGAPVSSQHELCIGKRVTNGAVKLL